MRVPVSLNGILLFCLANVIYYSSHNIWILKLLTAPICRCCESQNVLFTFWYDIAQQAGVRRNAIHTDLQSSRVGSLDAFLHKLL